MKHPILALVIVLVVATLACGSATPSAIPTPKQSVFDSGRTAYGFFPSPPELTSKSLMEILQAIGQHGDVILLQKEVPWTDFLNGSDGKSQSIQEQRDLTTLAARNGLEVIYVVDPLNGLDRRQFAPLPPQLEGANFGTPAIRQAFKNYTLRLVREFHPRYLGLASEINTYADAHPEDFPNYLSLYHELYAAIKAESPDTQVFVTFQWDDLNNVIPFDTSRSEPYQTKWEQVVAFEPDLDVWAISTYPFVAFDSAAEIPVDYYTPLLTRTNKPLAVAEGGYNSQEIQPFHGTPQDQVDYLNAIHSQIGNRLDFWIYLILNDINLEAYIPNLAANGLGGTANTLGWFGYVGLRSQDGTSKPALATWDSFRTSK
jgi:hypothetical protein